MVLEKTLENPLDFKEIKPVNPKGNQSWIFTGRTDAEAEAPILWPPDVKSRLTGRDPDAGKDWRQEEKGTKEDEMVGWHHWLNGDEFEQALGDAAVHGVAKSHTQLSDWTTTLSMRLDSSFLIWNNHQQVFLGYLCCLHTILNMKSRYYLHCPSLLWDSLFHLLWDDQNWCQWQLWVCMGTELRSL